MQIAPPECQSRAMSERPTGLTLSLRANLDAPRERVFSALTKPAELATWWGPHGFTTQVTELDLTVGGGYRFSMQPPDGDVFHLSGEFLEIDPPRRLVYTSAGRNQLPTTGRPSSRCRSTPWVRSQR